MTCPASTTTTTTTTTLVSPTPSPMETGNPGENVVDYYNSSETTENICMQNSATSFCKNIASNNFGPGYFHQDSYDLPYNGGIGFVHMAISMEIFNDCNWDYSLDEYERYLRVPTDSYNCSGIDGKQGSVVSNNCYKFRIDPNRAFS